MALKADLVERIKGLQRTDGDFKQAWWSYCDEQQGGVKDPKRHDETSLSTFLSMYQSGGYQVGGGGGYTPRPHPRAPVARYTPMPSVSPSYKGGHIPAARQMYAVTPQPTPGLAEVVKMGQRSSQQWRAAWQTFCGIYGNMMNDPAKHPESFLKQFLDFVGDCALKELSAEPGETSEPPAKRMRPTMGESLVGDAHKQALVEKIKSLQRSDQTAKQQWWDFADAYNKGVRDPNRTDTATLERFLAEHGLS
mmetsp:Transcript_14134/g.26465  ORF Transcript_14134/g.26465 Transcript_14134/m.26465 type:complete len:250 (+) Transcript_14134:75-824(+)